jgi:hypothetical protein
MGDKMAKGKKSVKFESNGAITVTMSEELWILVWVKITEAYYSDDEADNMEKILDIIAIAVIGSAPGELHPLSTKKEQAK